MALKLDIEQVKEVLTVSDLITSWQVLTQDETADRALYRIRCQLLRPAYRLEVRLIATENETIYSYQLFTDRPLIRWDNAPHFPALDTFPHHVHQESGEVEEAHLSGDPLQDLPGILNQVRAFLAKPSI
ncbi:MAG: toxin-antitoxin system TumE family protein [Candidatus Binatia bacterium]